MKFIREPWVVWLVSAYLSFALWYVGSNGEAGSWSLGSLSFGMFFLAINASVWMSGILATPVDLRVRKLGRGIPALTLFAARVAVQLLIWVVSVFITTAGVLIIVSPGSAIPSTLVDLFLAGEFWAITALHGLASCVWLLLLGLQGTAGFRSAWVSSWSGRRPNQQEKKGFLFIDLDHSTTIAERLGDVRYSKFIRECFQVLDTYVQAYRFDLYQYVGDEVVLVWDLDDSKKVEDAIRMYHGFKHALSVRHAYFRSQFGIEPSFKCSIHGGNVIHTSMGDPVSHVVYHGDVLNTASRILDQAHAYGVDLLLSQSMLALLGNSSDYIARWIDTIQLRGKVEKVALYTVQSNGFPRTQLSGGLLPAASLYPKVTISQKSKIQ